MKLVSVHLTEAQLRTLKRNKCRVRRIGPWLYEVTNRRGKVYTVKLTKCDDGSFGYVCRDETGALCQSVNFGNTCRHATSAALVCVGRNEMLKRAA